MQALSERNDPQTVATKQWSPGRSRISRKTIAQGRPDDPPVPVVLPRAFLLHAGHGCGGHPAFPAPSSVSRAVHSIAWARSAPRDYGGMSVIGATRWFAMTASDGAASC